MPAEWEPQSAIWLSWPHNTETWPENLAKAQTEFIQFANTIGQSQPVFVMASGEALDQARLQFKASESIDSISFVDIATNDAWARDYAPTFVLESNENTGQNLVAIDWHYNAWGGKYPPFDNDQKVARQVAKRLDIECESLEFCFEGGAVEVNGIGVLLCTKSCALDPNRNAETDLATVEGILKTRLGVETIIWLAGEAIDGDDTDGHIDQLARFTDERTIVYAWTEPSDPQYAGLAKNLRDLETQLAQHNIGDTRLIPLPIPGPIEYCGRRIPASYANFLIANEIVIVPQFGVEEDEQAVKILQPLFPNRVVIGLASKNLSVGLGSFHCLSQQQPVAPPTQL